MLTDLIRVSSKRWWPAFVIVPRWKFDTFQESVNPPWNLVESGGHLRDILGCIFGTLGSFPLNHLQ